MPRRRPAFVFVTGTDTSVGKTVLTACLARHLRRSGCAAVALKPLCSGSRQDALRLHRAAGRVLPLDLVNPWFFRPALAPVLAARAAGKTIRLRQVVQHLRRTAAGFDLVLVEGAGGLLSPMGEDFDSRDLLLALKARALIVTPNTLGAVGRVRLALAALPPATARSARVVLMQPARPDTAARSNPGLLAEYFPASRLHLFPRLPAAESALRPLLESILG